MWRKSSTEMLLASFENPKMESDEPSRENILQDILDPKWVKSKIDKLLPSFAYP
jgi:hypothetical protein